MRLMSLVVAMALVLPQVVLAQEGPPPLTLELNKLETVAATNGGAASCRAYLVANDPEGGPKFEALRLDLVLFGTDGVISRRIALDIGPVQPGRMQVLPFDLRDVPCDGIGQILINNALICKVGGADQTDCLDRVKTTSRVSAKLIR